MATTTNFGWETPDDTDLVKDGALAIRTLGSAIDTSLVDLKGGTTGQVLSKTSNTDMDFTWVTSDDANAIQNAIVDAKGDLIAASAADTPARLAVGNNGETLVADSSATTGLRWQGSYEAGKNRIINGAMVIDQRNAGAAVTVNSTTGLYPVDRFAGVGQATDGVFTLQQDSDAPSGFSKSIKATVTTADASIGATQHYFVRQIVENGQIFDFDFGKATAKTFTLSFWVRSSLTGTFGGAFRNADANRSYPFTYTISSANTWEKKSVTLVADTTGTWGPLTTDVGVNITWSLGAGTDRLGTAGAWNSNNNTGATGQTQVISTVNATWYITGVQLELGSVATQFSMSAGTLAGELAACQRYYFRFTGDNLFAGHGIGVANGTTSVIAVINHPTTMRVKPTSADFSTLRVESGSDDQAVTAVTLGHPGIGRSTVTFTVASGLTTSRAYNILNNNSLSGYFGLNAEL